MIKFFVMYS